MAKFTLLDRIGTGPENHILMAEEFIQLSKEASFQACTIIGGFREGTHEDQIEIIIRFQHHPRELTST